MVKPDIYEVMSPHLEKITDRGSYISACCPFHDDNSPSLAIYKDKQRFHCFGCGERGDVIDFVRKLHNVSYPKALKMLEIKEDAKDLFDMLMPKKEKDDLFGFWISRIRDLRIAISGPDLRVVVDNSLDLYFAGKLDQLENTLNSYDC